MSYERRSWSASKPLTAAIAVAAIGFVASGCAASSGTAVAMLEAALPTLEEHQVEEMWFHDRTSSSGRCAFIRYGAGWYASGDGCGARGRDVRAPFDADVWDDVATIQAAVGGAGDTLEYLRATYDESGSLVSGSFRLDSCRDYYYEPDYSALPLVDSAEAEVLTDDWYMISSGTLDLLSGC